MRGPAIGWLTGGDVLVEEDEGTGVYCKDDLLPTSRHPKIQCSGEPGGVVGI